MELKLEEPLYYVYGRLESEPTAAPAHLILVSELNPDGVGRRVKKVLAACTTIAAATAAGSLLSGRTLER